jgi:hypothetical protein
MTFRINWADKGVRKRVCLCLALPFLLAACAIMWLGDGEVTGEE